MTVQWSDFGAAVTAVSGDTIVGLQGGTTNKNFDVLSWLLSANNLSDVASATAAFGNIAPTTTAGDMIYYNGTANARLALGTLNYFLVAGSTAPTYTSPAASATLMGLGTGSAAAFASVTTTGINKVSVTNAITAHSGGGQGSAVALTTAINRITTVAAAADSVKLPAAVAGEQCIVINAAASNALACFPASGDAINALAANTALSIAVGKPVLFNCAVTGTWDAIVSA